ncbi:hypothetical protein FQZ97_1033610 [compost metagenome]
MRDPRDGFLGPVHAGGELHHAQLDSRFRLIEPADLGPGLRLAAGVGLGIFDVHTQRYAVLVIVCEQIQPLVIAALVQEVRFDEQKLGDLLQQRPAVLSLRVVRRRHQ